MVWADGGGEKIKIMMWVDGGGGRERNRKREEEREREIESAPTSLSVQFSVGLLAWLLT